MAATLPLPVRPRTAAPTLYVVFTVEPDGTVRTRGVYRRRTDRTARANALRLAGHKHVRTETWEPGIDR